MIDIFGIKIITNYESINYEAIGLYAVSGGNSEIRYIETELTGLSESWKSGFLFANSFPTFSKSGSFVRGGNTIQLRGSTIRIKNTNRLQAILESDDYKINLIGASVEIVEFRGTDESTITETRNIFTGTIDSVKWSSTEMEIEVVPSRRKLRRSNIVTEGIPVTFGKSDPANGRFFKIPRTKNIDEDLNVLDFTNDINKCYPKKMNLFPEIDLGGTTSSELRVCCRIGAYDNDIFTTLPDLLIGKYICVEEDNSTENLLSGLNRLIVAYVGNGVVEEIDIDGVHLYSVYVTLDLQDYLPVKPEGNIDGNHENQVWYKIKNVEIEYQVETENVSGFYDSDTGEIVDVPEIYTKEKDRIEKLLSAACDIELSGKKVLFNPRMIKGDINKIQSLHIEPIKTLSEYTADDLSGWGISDTLKLASGFYQYELGEHWSVSNYSGIGSDTSPVYDRNHSTYCSYSIDFTSPLIAYFVAFRFLFPDIPDNLKFDNVYLGIRGNSVILGAGLPSFNRGSFRVLTRGHVGRLKTRIDADQVVFHPGTILNAVAIENLPDFYYKTDRQTGNNAFFISQENESALTGLEKFDLGISNHDEYNNITECLVLIKKFLNPTATNRSGSEVTNIHQLALIFEKNNELGDAIYV